MPSFQRPLVAQALKETTGYAASNLEAQNTCAAPQAGHASCYAEVLKVKSSGELARPELPRQSLLPLFGASASPLSGPALSLSPASVLPNTEPTTTNLPTVGTPAYMQQAYDVSGLAATQGANDTIAIVDVGDDPTAATDLATYRSYFSLPACTEASGCLTIVNEQGQTKAQAGTAWPAENSSWQAEESLDLDAVTAVCPLCHILLVEANSSSNSDLSTAEGTAAAWPGISAISDSWGAYSTTPVNEFNYPGVAVFASTGDDGYAGTTPNWPAASPHVTAVGGTTLSADKTGAIGNRGFLETSWDDAGSGCATTLAVPSYQAGLATGCAGRAIADVSADANPATGLGVYSSYYGGWTVVGGTSLAAPLTAAFTTVAGINAESPSWAYSVASGVNDITSGANVGQPGDTVDSTDCGDALCHAGTGWDGITGVGAINGAVAVTAQAPGISGAGVCANVCAPSGDLGYVSGATSTSLQLAAQVQTNGLATTYHWEYGTSPPPSGATDSATTSLAASSSPSQATASLTGLAPGTDYYYRLVASNSVGTTYGYTYEMQTPVSAPAMTSAPYISGTAQQGGELSFQSGAWTGNPTSYTYSWYENSGSGWHGVSGSGTTNQSFYPAASDVGAEVEGVIAVANSSGTSTYTTATVGPITASGPTSVSTPAVTGDAWVGATLTAQQGGWSAPDSISYAYQWRADEFGTWTNIVGATNVAYAPVVAEIGDALEVVVTATDAYGSTTAVSAPTSAIAPGTPRNVSPPLLSGTAKRLSTMSATGGGWDWTGYSYAYQWQRCSGDTCSDINGATASTYKPTAADEGDTLDVVVTASDANGSASAVSAPSAGVAAAPPSEQTAPTISGSQPGGFTATAGAWSPSDVTTSYQWQRCSANGTNCSNIGGATGASYVPQAADAGDVLRALITATNPDGSSAATTADTPVMGSGTTSTPTAPAGGSHGGTTPTPITGSDGQRHGSGTHRGAGRGSARLTIKARGGLRDGLGLIGETLKWTVGGAQAAVATRAKFIRCLRACTTVRNGRIYKIRRADAGALLRAAASTRGRTTYGRSVIGPVVTAWVAGARIKRGTVRVRTARHVVYATAHLVTVGHGKRRTRKIVVTRRQVKGRLTTWVCPLPLSARGKPRPCTRHLRLAKRRTFRVAWGAYAVIVVH